MLGTTVQALAVGGLPLARLLRPEPARLTATALLYFVSSCCSATGVTLCIVATNACGPVGGGTGTVVRGDDGGWR